MFQGLDMYQMRKVLGGNSTHTTRSNQSSRARVLSVARSYELQARKLKFVREVVYAASGLGLDGIDDLGQIDAAYSDPRVDVGGVVDIDTEAGRLMRQLGSR